MGALETPVRSLAESVRDSVSLFAEGYISADDLNDALPDTGALDESGDREAMRLAMLVIGLLAEYQDGYRAEDDLREALREYASWAPRRDDGEFRITLTASGAAQEAVGARTPLEVVYAS